MGALTTKAVVLKDDEVIGQSIILATDEGAVQAKRALDEALKGSGIPADKVEYIVVTGEGRKSVPFANKEKTTPTAIGKGANRLFPSAGMVIDVGGESCHVIRLTPKGGVEDSMSNDRCASGTGVFLETMTKYVLHLTPEEMTRLGLQSDQMAEITSTCAIFAEQEVISHIHRQPPTPLPEVVGGIYNSIVSRVVGVAKRLIIEPDVVLAGGLAKDQAFVKTVERAIRRQTLVSDNPQLVSAIGAALVAQDRARQSNGKKP